MMIATHVHICFMTQHKFLKSKRTTTIQTENDIKAEEILVVVDECVKSNKMKQQQNNNHKMKI